MFTIGHITSLSFLSSPFLQLVSHFLSSFCLLAIFFAICLSSQFLFCEGFVAQWFLVLLLIVQWSLVFTPIYCSTKVSNVVAPIVKVLSCSLVPCIVAPIVNVLNCSLVPSVVALIIVQQRFYICYFSTPFFFCNVESTKICVVGHSHSSFFTSLGMFDHVLWNWI